MLEKIKLWLQGLRGASASAASDALRQSGAHRSARPVSGERRRTGPDRRKQPDYVDIEPQVAGKIEDDSPGENVLVRNKYKREDTGTHETLKIIDDSIVDSGEETGIDPYNTGNFDRSRNWDKRFRNR